MPFHPGLRLRRNAPLLRRIAPLLCLLAGLTGCASRQLTMQSEAMAPTLPFGTSFKVDYGAYTREPPRRYDLIIFAYERTAGPETSIQQPEPGTLICYRVIGLPGEMVEIRDNQVFINKVRMPLPGGVVYRPAPESEDFARFNRILLPRNGYFVLGDNSEKALDSRYWGFVRRDQFVGKVERE